MNVGHGDGWRDRVLWVLAGVAAGALVMGAAAALAVALVDEPSSDETLVANATAATAPAVTTEPDVTGGGGRNSSPSGANTDQKPGGGGASQSGASGQSNGANTRTPSPTPESTEQTPAPANPAQPQPQDQPQTTELELTSPDDGDLKFQPGELDAQAGEVTLDYTNPSEVTHSIALESNGGDKIGEGSEVKNGKTSTVSSELTPGTYTYFCTLPGHREAGMEGTLTVK